MTRQFRLKMIDIVVIMASGLFLQFSKGIFFLTHNQNSYFIYGMRLSDPNFIPNDWFTWKTFHHDFAFAYLFCFLHHFKPLSAVIIVTDILLLMAMAASLLALCRRFCVYPWVSYMLLIVWVGIVNHSEMGLGGQYIFHGFLQPSEVAGCLMIIGLSLLLNHRFLFSGIVLGIAGMFHASYMVSFCPAIIATAISAGVLRQWKTIVAFGLPLAVCWGTLVLMVTSQGAHLAGGKDIIDIMIRLRGSGDFVLSQWPLDWTVNWFVWALLGSVAMLQAPKEGNFRQLQVCFLALLVTSLFSIAQMATLNISSITLLMLWRSSPMVLILGQVLVIDRWLRLLIDPKSITSKDKFFIGISLLALIWLLGNQWGWSIGVHKTETNRRFLWLATFLAAWGINIIALSFAKVRQLRPMLIIVVMSVIMTAIVFKSSWAGLKMSCNFATHPESTALSQMETWIRANTSEGSIFVVPPDMEYMRLRVRRAIVVDWSSSCYLPGDMRQWYQRICDISGLPTKPLVKDFATLMQGYDRMNTARAKRLKDLYGASYVVVRARWQQGDLRGLTKLYANEDYQVYQIP